MPMHGRISQLLFGSTSDVCFTDAVSNCLLDEAVALEKACAYLGKFMSRGVRQRYLHMYLADHAGSSMMEPASQGTRKVLATSSANI